jgi:hypothetical protein
MHIDRIAEVMAGHLLGRLLRRAFLALAVIALSVVALSYFTAAGMMALEAQLGMLHARLIIGAIYALVAIVGAIWWLACGRPAGSSVPLPSAQRDMQIAMLVEAVMLGYALAQKGSRAP